MAPKSATSITERDVKLIIAAMKSAKAPLEIDYQILADEAGLKNTASARAAWHGLKKKLDTVAAAGAAAADADGGDEGRSELESAWIVHDLLIDCFIGTNDDEESPKKRKAEAKDEESEAKTEEGAEEEAPKTKKKKKGGNKKKAAAMVKAEDDGDEDA